mmetsp:Transcript_32932/g.33243  ORF Transcript_32932/g.33243 Transcript_32932/m.33243 type:complete len:84 (+) Transcript_32932:712-963(+)
MEDVVVVGIGEEEDDDNNSFLFWQLLLLPIISCGVKQGCMIEIIDVGLLVKISFIKESPLGDFSDPNKKPSLGDFMNINDEAV